MHHAMISTSLVAKTKASATISLIGAHKTCGVVMQVDRDLTRLLLLSRHSLGLQPS